jgi:hypothetical protein
VNGRSLIFHPQAPPYTLEARKEMFMEPETVTEKVIKEEIMKHLEYAKGLSYQVLWRKVVGVNFRFNNPESDHTFRRALESLVKAGKIVHENGWVALVRSAEGV